MPFGKSLAATVLLLALSACGRPDTDPWPRLLRAATGQHLSAVSEAEREAYEAGFANGAAMVHEALKAGIRPYRPVLDMQEATPAAPQWRGAVPEGVVIQGPQLAPEVDLETGLLQHAAAGAKGGAFARGQTEGFSWALAAIGQRLVVPVPERVLPGEWIRWQDHQKSRALQSGAQTARMGWAPGSLMWSWTERGFPSRRYWRPWTDQAAPGWVGFMGKALWIETRSGQAIALDIESAGILYVRPASTHEPPNQPDLAACEESIRNEFDSPAYQETLRRLRQAAEFGGITECMPLTEHLHGMGEQADREAYGWYLKAAEKGHPEAMLKVGVRLFHGDSTPADKPAARRWLEAAVRAGHPQAPSVLEMLFGSDLHPAVEGR